MVLFPLVIGVGEGLSENEKIGSACTTGAKPANKAKHKPSVRSPWDKRSPPLMIGLPKPFSTRTILNEEDMSNVARFVSPRGSTTLLASTATDGSIGGQRRYPLYPQTLCRQSHILTQSSSALQMTIPQALAASSSRPASASFLPRVP
jgi:hypothetical protein